MKPFKLLVLGIALVAICTSDAHAQKYQWAKGNSSANITPRKTAIDKKGHSIIAGQYKTRLDFNFSDAPADTAYLSATPSGTGFSVFFAKYKSDGSFLWANRIYNGRSNQSADIVDIETDDSGNVYLAGSYSGWIDFNPSDAPADTATRYSTVQGTTYYSSMYIAKYDSNGNFKWVMNFRGSAPVLNDIAVKGNLLYVTGVTRTITSLTMRNTDFNPSELPADTLFFDGAIQNNAFLAVYDLAGNLKMAQRLNNAVAFNSAGIDADNSKNIYLTGTIRGKQDFDPASGMADTAYLNAANGTYLAKYDSAGKFKWVQPVLTNDNMTNEQSIIKLSPADDIYVTGAFKGISDFNPDADPEDTLNLRANTILPATSAWISRYNTAGDFDTAFTLGGIGITDAINAISFDDSGNFYIAGDFMGAADFNLSAAVGDTFLLRSVGTSFSDIFFAKYRHDTLVWVRKIGNSDYQSAVSMAVRNISSRISTLRLFGKFNGDVFFNPVLPIDISSQLIGGGTFLASYALFPRSSEKELLSYAFATPASTGIISHDSVFVTVPFGTPLGSLVASFTVSPYATAYVGSVLQVSSSTANSFAAPVTYTVMAEDSSTKDYKVFVQVALGIPGVNEAATVKVWPNPAHDFLALSDRTDVKLYDMRGVLIKTAIQTTVLPLNDVAPGVYILETAGGYRHRIAVY